MAIDPEELQRYLDAVGPAFRQAMLDRQAIDRELTAPGAETQGRDVAAWFVRMTDLRLELVDAVKGVDPPEGLISIHDEFVLATAAWVLLGDRVVEMIAEAGSLFNVGTDLAGNPALGTISPGQLSDISYASCASIERLAAANGIDADLSCDAIFN